jgi:hypothetical protein
VALFVGGAYAGRGSFEHVSLASLASVLGSVAFLLGVTAGAVAGTTLSRGLERGGAVVAGAGLGATLALAGATLSVFPGIALNHADLAAAKRHVEALASQVEEHRADHGAVPTRLADLGELPPGPRMIRAGRVYYRSDGESFSLSFTDPEALGFVDWTWSSRTGDWTRKVD